MKKIRIAHCLWILGFVVFLTQNFYFGWNLEPMSEDEVVADLIVRIIFYVGFVFYLIPAFSLYESAIKKYEEKK